MGDNSALSPAAMAAAASAAALHDNDKLASSSSSSPINDSSSNHWFEKLSSPIQFCVLASGVFFFFGIHNYLQEAIMSVEGFHYGVMLGYLEVLGVTVCSFLERRYIARETKRVAPMSAYPLLTFCLMSSSSLSNLALNYINFPTKVYVKMKNMNNNKECLGLIMSVAIQSHVSRSPFHRAFLSFFSVFRSCKLIPTMIVASIVHRKVFTSIEYFCAFCVCLGLVLFAAADWNLTPTFHPIGLAFVSLSVCADAVLPNAQERLFRLGSSRLEVTCKCVMRAPSIPFAISLPRKLTVDSFFSFLLVFTNIFTLIAMTITTLLSGDLLGMVAFAQTNSHLCHYILVYTFVAYIAISVHMNVVRRFGGVAAVLLATGRKGMTLVLSFILFPKAFSWYYVMGAILVLGGLLLSSLAKMKSRKKQQIPQQQLTRQHRTEEMGPLLIGDNNFSRQSRPFDIEHNEPNTNGHGKSNVGMVDRPESPLLESTNGGGGFFSRVHSHQQ
jgi:solute carrier family 35 (adenosine 3'-phospho 5'-phosphosulfate transporter), member B3